MIHNGKVYYVYSTHKTFEAADDALDDYFCYGIISIGEKPDIIKLSGRNTWAVIFPDNY
jgi:hypothetical protein